MVVTWRRVWRAAGVATHIAMGLMICALWLAPLEHLASARTRAYRQRVVRGWMRWLLVILGVRLKVSGAPHGEPALMVANHVSWLDIPCILGHADTVFVAKSEVRRWPLIGRLATSAGTIFLTRGGGAEAAIARMTTALNSGLHTVIFPEATSTHGHEVRPFHARLFAAAQTTGAAVQPVAIRYPLADGIHPLVPFVNDDAFVPHLWRLLGESRIDAEILFLVPHPSRGAKRRALAEHSRDQIRAALGLMPQPRTSRARPWARRATMPVVGMSPAPHFTRP